MEAKAERRGGQTSRDTPPQKAAQPPGFLGGVCVREGGRAVSALCTGPERGGDWPPRGGNTERSLWRYLGELQGPGAGSVTSSHVGQRHEHKVGRGLVTGTLRVGSLGEGVKGWGTRRGIQSRFVRWLRLMGFGLYAGRDGSADTRRGHSADVSRWVAGVRLCHRTRKLVMVREGFRLVLLYKLLEDIREHQPRMSISYTSAISTSMALSPHDIKITKRKRFRLVLLYKLLEDVQGTPASKHLASPSHILPPSQSQWPRPHTISRSRKEKSQKNSSPY